MANKSLGTRQKLIFRLDPAQTKPRNPVVLAAKQSGAGSHQKSKSSIRQTQKIILKKIPIKGDQD
jgi:hypothetical protein